MLETRMNIEDVDLAALEAMAPQELIRFAVENFGQRCAIGTSLQKTGVIIIDMAAALARPYRVFFVDTLHNFPETYELLDEIEKRYAIAVERFTPAQEELDWLHKTFGQWPHYLAREHCCRVRKGRPHERAMATLDVWISGLRSDQSDHRREHARKASLEPAPKGRKVLKINPLLFWTSEQVDEYTTAHALPYNKLYDYVSPLGERYGVIGCPACHIPVKEEFGKRAGKFPWEHGKKECGLHKDGEGI
ncbi:MAG: phosphoadenylyl-sulfate reductase [Planctomycetaceae bacterium]|nr:phosphoadenylyl-sulfate reductase [Planctomycetaceae bacterium]